MILYPFSLQLPSAHSYISLTLCKHLCLPNCFHFSVLIRQLSLLSLFMKYWHIIMPSQNSISNHDWCLFVKPEFCHERIYTPNFLSEVNKIVYVAEGWYLFQPWRVLCSKSLHPIRCVLDKLRLICNGLWDPTSAFKGSITTVTIYHL